MSDSRAAEIGTKAAQQAKGNKVTAVYMARNRCIAADISWPEVEEEVIAAIDRALSGEQPEQYELFDPPVSIPPDLVVDDMLYALAPEVWHLPRDEWAPVWAKATGSGVKIAILDTGYAEHPDLPRPLATASFISGQSVVDRHGHGTHCAGTALGRNGIGVAPGADLIVGKVLSNSGSGSSSGIAAGIRWATEQGADVISMSLGGGSSYGPTNEAIDAAFAQGTIVTASAGNSGYSGRGSTIGWPARYSGCLANAAYDRNLNIANFSSGGPQVDYACPGVNIISCSNNGSGYRSMSGTSMSNPFGAGILALIIERQRREGSAQFTAVQAVRDFFKANMEDAGAPGFDYRFGHGIPEAAELLSALTNETLDWV